MALTDHIRTFDEFMAMPTPEQGWLIEGVLPHPGLGEVFAIRGVGKTWAALSLATAVAYRQPWLTSGLVAQVSRSVLYIDGEMMAAELQRRLKGLVGLGPAPLRIASLAGVAPIPNFANDGEWTKLGEACKELGIEVVIMDNWACLVRGVDENDNKRTAEVMSGPIALRAAGLSVIWVHHAGKDADRGQRGASSREDALDFVLRLKGESKGREARFEAELDKSRRAVRWEPVDVELREIEGKFMWCGSVDKAPAMAQKYLEFMKNREVWTDAQLRREGGGNGVTHSKAIEWLKRNGRVAKRDGGWVSV